MLFSSIVFLFTFLPITLLIYYLVPRKAKNAVLLFFSLIFYAWGEPVYILLLIISTLFNYFSAFNLAGKKGRKRTRRRRLIFTITVNLLILGFFKYYGFAAVNLNAVLPFNIPYRELELPIGISFYTLQTLSYIMDVYRGKAKVQTNLIDFGTYVTMFPRLVAGPVVQYTDIEKQLKRRQESLLKLGQGVRFFVVGLAKKVLLADMVGAVYAEAASMPETSVLTAWIGCIAYTFQIYFDFSGYSDMALGLGKMFGFEFPKNFDYPYTSKSVTEFWRRWHISLGNWFREYVYIPLGDRRVSVPGNVFNMLLVWLLIGVWHGAGWNFVIWGLYYGLILAIEKYVTGRLLKRFPAGVRILYTMFLVIIGWVLFFSPGVKAATVYLGRMFGAGAAGIIDRQALYLIKSNWMLWIALLVGSTPAVYRLGQVTIHTEERPRAVLAAVLYSGMFLLCIAYLVTGTYNTFLFLRF